GGSKYNRRRCGLCRREEGNLGAGDSSGVRVYDFDLEIGGEGRNGKKSQRDNSTKHAHAILLDTREGLLVVAIRTGLLASRVRTRGVQPGQPAFPGIFPSDRLRVSSLTVARQRGIHTRFPIPVRADGNARTEEFKRAEKSAYGIYLGWEGKSTRGAGDAGDEGSALVGIPSLLSGGHR